MTQPPNPPTPPQLDAPAQRTAPIPNLRVQDNKFREADFLGLDPRSRDPNKHYRWVRIDANGRSVVRKKARGYTVETHRKGGPQTIVEADKRADNAIAIGDSVLMSCSRQLHEERQRVLRKRNEDLLASTSANTLEEAKRKGVTTITEYEGRTR